MGHAYPSNLDRLMMRRIYAKGSASIGGLVLVAQAKGEKLSCAEGEYADKWMLAYGFEMCINWHRKDYCDKNETPGVMIEPIISSDVEKAAMDAYENGDLWEMNYSDPETLAFLNIRWKFAPGGRQAYINDTIQYLVYYES